MKFTLLCTMISLLAFGQQVNAQSQKVQSAQIYLRSGELDLALPAIEEAVVMFLMFCAGVAFWIIYGVLNGDWPVIIANVVTLTLASIILGFKFRYPT